MNFVNNSFVAGNGMMTRHV